MPTILHPTVTDAGKAAAIAADASGLELELTDLSFHDYYFTPDGTETSIPNQHVKVPIIGTRVNPTQIRLSGIWSDNYHLDTKDIGSIGIWAGSTLFAVYAKSAAPPFGVKTPSVDFVGFYEMALSVVPPGSVNVIISDDSALLAALTLHESAADPHPQYQLKVQQFNQMTTVYCTDNGSTPFSIKLNPPAGQTVPARIAGQRWLFRAIHSNTIPDGEYYTNQPTNFEPSPFPPSVLLRKNGQAVLPGEIVAGTFYEAYWDGAAYVLADSANDLRETSAGKARHELLINGCFQVNTEVRAGYSDAWISDIKGDPFAPFGHERGIYVADCWQMRRPAGYSGVGASVQRINAPAPQVLCGKGIKFSEPIIASGGASIQTNPWVITNTLTAANTQQALGKSVTFSVHLTAPIPETFKVYLAIGVRDFGGYAQSDDVADRPNSTPGPASFWTIEINKTELDLDGATATHQRFSITATIPANARQIAARIIVEPQDVPGAYDVARELYISGANMRIGRDDYQTQVPLIETTRDLCAQFLKGVSGDFGTTANGIVIDSTHVLMFTDISPNRQGYLSVPTVTGANLLSDETTDTISIAWLDTGTGSIVTTRVDDVTIVSSADTGSGPGGFKLEVELALGFPALPAAGTRIWLYDIFLDGRLY